MNEVENVRDGLVLEITRVRDELKREIKYSDKPMMFL
jgi:hypothetical protein